MSNILQDQFVTEKSQSKEYGPMIMNAFEMITLSQGLNLSALFDRRQVCMNIFNLRDIPSDMLFSCSFSSDCLWLTFTLLAVFYWSFFFLHHVPWYPLQDILLNAAVVFKQGIGSLRFHITSCIHLIVPGMLIIFMKSKIYCLVQNLIWIHYVFCNVFEKITEQLSQG